MFLGQYAHSLDPKGRVTIPAAFRPSLDDGLYVTCGEDPCLVIYTPSDWEALAASVSLLPKASRQGRAFSRMVFGRAHAATLDSMGRLLLPSFLREYAGIEDQALVVGVNNLIELWAPEQWQAMLERTSQNVDEIMAKLVEMGI